MRVLLLIAAAFAALVPGGALAASPSGLPPGEPAALWLPALQLGGFVGAAVGEEAAPAGEPRVDLLAEGDEGTTDPSDDDGDAYNELEGDCDDTDEDVYPGAPERGDHLDNDCDGTIDETTALYDDDGDGFAEVDNDCDDADPAVNPDAEEIEDGIDNDCDGLRD